MLRVERIGQGRAYQLVADLFWGGAAVDGRMVVAVTPIANAAEREVIERLAKACDNSIDRTTDQECRDCARQPSEPPDGMAPVTTPWRAGKVGDC
jgi:hypothetical protein